MKDQRPNLNTLPPTHPISVKLRIHECRVRDPPGASIGLGIKTLDQSDQIWCLTGPVVPAMLKLRRITRCFGLGLQRPRTNGVRLALTIRIDQLRWHQVGIWHCASICNGQGVLENRPDRTPDIYDLVSATEELLCIVRKVMEHAIRRCCVRLVYVDALYWATRILTASIVLGCTADCVVEDEYLLCAGSVLVSFINSQ